MTVLLTAAVAVAVTLVVYVLSKWEFAPSVIDPKRVQELAQQVLLEIPNDDDKDNKLDMAESSGASSKGIQKERAVERRMRRLTQLLVKEYPGRVENPFEPDRPVNGNPNWMFVMVGGAIGQMLVLHMSFSGYIILFGSAKCCEGHSGRYIHDCYDIILQGKHYGHRDTELIATETKEGEVTTLMRGDAIVYKIPRDTWMVEVGHGFPGVLVASLWPLAATFCTTLDFYTFWKQTKLVAPMIWRQMLQGRLF